MMKTKLISAMMVALLVVGTTAITASAAELPSTPEKTAPTIAFDQEAKQAALEEKGVAFEQAMAAMEFKMLAVGKTPEEIATMQAKFTEKFEGLKAEKAATIMENKATREEKAAAKSAAQSVLTQTAIEMV
ncbi:hypothetical protein RFF05_04390 [Bengtsoniella intestinalis]|uniref:hypothetical protein n=1 Tax=Bengtsoniella intestinalis TaxID=3073143 RepID=UPI00391FBEB3